ncbi:N-carbamoyl-L-amino acid hydrolase [Caenispirillum salinarum AK4]|uniref:N-carbamoyl-L-amino acid hydrolase n=1 Tax=Caenispirillum salinarum AK4 TaxID=1238182 RepID=K9GTB8_9PROT|nr:allantoate amidohydrolase [Caenispirillum salinarum]EKV29225.1 N-carbamoyl-L-amino acid hydrolase [Caenispirillum salinarum AK4]
MTAAPSAETILARCDALAAHTEEPGRLTRTFLTPVHAAAAAEVRRWMEAAGMTVRMDGMANLIGRYEGKEPDAPAVLIGSHLDTVRDAGRYDGMLGVLLGIDAVARLNAAGRRLPFAVEVVGFGDEEGVRFARTLLGSRALAGTLDAAALDAADTDGTTLAQALEAFGLAPDAWRAAALDPARVRAYLEVHIEQGPVLEHLSLPVGVVTAIAGATRLAFALGGEAGHAGTVPMEARRDALAGAAEAVLAVETVAQEHGVVATVGALEVAPGAVNVVPGRVRFTVDLRAAEDAARESALEDLRGRLQMIAARRGLTLAAETLHENAACPCSPSLTDLLAEAVEDQGLPAHRLMSGAGHDAMAMADLCDVAMLFVRCAGGVSHNPAESVTAEDVAVAADVLSDALVLLAERPPFHLQEPRP